MTWLDLTCIVAIAASTVAIPTDRQTVVRQTLWTVFFFFFFFYIRARTKSGSLESNAGYQYSVNIPGKSEMVDRYIIVCYTRSVGEVIRTLDLNCLERCIYFFIVGVDGGGGEERKGWWGVGVSVPPRSVGTIPEVGGQKNYNYNGNWQLLSLTAGTNNNLSTVTSRVTSYTDNYLATKFCIHKWVLMQVHS